MQATQVPSMQTRPVPHGVPLELLPDATHVDTPVEHEVIPALQGSVKGQVFKAAQATHAPALHTLSIPQLVPSWMGSPLSAQLMVGEQTFLPAWQGFVGVQESPTVQGTHAPPLQTLPVPHGVPFAAFPDSRQTGAPVLQTVMPVRQGFPGTGQLDPATHATQVAVALQIMSFPQEVPAARLIPVSVHAATPPVQVSAPLLHGFVGVQASPATQAVHTPAWQTMPIPQDAPSG
jgi:hypothetical protein